MDEFLVRFDACRWCTLASVRSPILLFFSVWGKKRFVLVQRMCSEDNFHRIEKGERRRWAALHDAFNFTRSEDRSMIHECNAKCRTKLRREMLSARPGRRGKENN